MQVSTKKSLEKHLKNILSLQRKHQKLVEIAPSPSLDPTDRKNMIESALKMAASVSYRSLGTFEFLFVPHTRDFYFMEINPRIQVSSLPFRRKSLILLFLQVEHTVYVLESAMVLLALTLFL